MRLASTQDPQSEAGFIDAVMRCLPDGGGLYCPASEADLSPWIFHLSESAPFSSIAGALTSALLKEDISPAICERLAFAAFSGSSPVLRQLDESLCLLELFHSPTGTHLDFGAMWLASAMEHILTIRGKNSVAFACASGVAARSLANAFAGKKRLKLVLICAGEPRPKGIPLDREWLAWNGGNVLPLSVSASEDDARRLIYAAYNDPEFMERWSPSIANTSNIGRLIPQIFFYIFAFSRLKKAVQGDIFYSVPSANYASLVAGFYAWKYCLPVNGFITDSSPMLCCDARGESLCMDFFAPAAAGECPAREIPSNIKRLEQVFSVNPLLLKGFVFPFVVPEAEIPAIQFEARKKHGVWLDRDTAKAFGVAEEFHKARERSVPVVVFANNDPAFELESVRRACGDAPDVSEAVKKTFIEGEAKELSELSLEPLRKIMAEFFPE